MTTHDCIFHKTIAAEHERYIQLSHSAAEHKKS